MKTTRINFTTIKLTLIAVLTGLFMTVAAQAATYTVDRMDDATVQTCTAAANDCTLRGAIAAANATAANDIIDFDATIFNIARTITLSGTQLSINNNGTLTINGTGASLLTISGNNVSRVFTINTGATAVINGITIANGNAAAGGSGGGIYSLGNLTFNNGIIRNSTASNGGGAIRTDSTSPTVVTNSTINNNTAGTGGGIDSNGNVSITITNSTINANTATGSSGGVANTGTMTVTNSTISGNSSPFGGGIANFGTSLTINSSTVSNNTASSSAGGLRQAGSGSTTLNNTIIANSTSGGDCVREAGTINALYSLIEANLTCVNGTNSNNRTGDPNLGALGNNGGSTQTHALLTGSIAIDKGNTRLATDQRGSPRPLDNASIPNATGGNGSDIGAFEVQVPTAAGVSVGGRVLVGKGRGLANARVYLVDQFGATHLAMTNPSGYYRFDDIAAGQTVFITIVSKRYQFASQIVSVTEDIEDLNFFAGSLN